MLGRVVGYAAGGCAYRVYNLASREVVVQRDVVVEDTPVDTSRTSSFLSVVLDPDSGSDLTAKTEDHSDCRCQSETPTPPQVALRPDASLSPTGAAAWSTRMS